MSQLYEQQIAQCFASHIGLEGITGDVAALSERYAHMLSPFTHTDARTAHPVLDTPYRTELLSELEAIIAKKAHWAKHVLILGTGGSSLGARMLYQLVDQPKRQLHFLENVDPHSIELMLSQIPLEECWCLSVSKSGGTVETISQSLIVWDRVRQKLGSEALTKHAALVTMPSDSPLKQIAESLSIPTLTHPPEIGGRYSVFTIVGLLPALLAGLDVSALLTGARSVVDAMGSATKPLESTPLLGAALIHQLARQGKSINVMMPYCDRLFEFGAWYRQLWAESLGKDGKGLTPLRALGVVDQHSQLQLYLEGPKDKCVTLIALDHAHQGPKLPDDFTDHPALRYLHGHTIGDVMHAEQASIGATLAHHGCPVRTLAIGTLSAETLGALLMHFIIETLATATLMGVDPYTQPAVEDGKQRTRDILAGTYPLDGEPNVVEARA